MLTARQLFYLGNVLLVCTKCLCRAITATSTLGDGEKHYADIENLIDANIKKP